MPLVQAPALQRPVQPVGPLVPPRPARTQRVEPGPPGWGELLACRASVVSFLRRRCRDVHQAEDIAQDAILRAMQRALSGRGEAVSRVRPWLVQIAANLHRDAHRKEAFETLVPDDSAVFAASEGREPVPGDQGPDSMVPVGGSAVESSELSRDLGLLLAKLPARDRALIERYHLEGRSMAEAARAAGCAPGLAKVRMYRARRRLERGLRMRHGRRAELSLEV